MGKAFAAVVRDYLDQEHTSMKKLAAAAGGLTFGAATNWKNGDATPERPAMLLLREWLPEEWRARFWQAWLQDNSEPEVWEAAQGAAIPTRDGLDEAYYAAKGALDQENAKRLTLLLAAIRRMPKRTRPTCPRARLQLSP